MSVTIPLRLEESTISDADLVIKHRDGSCSRNAVLREAVKKGLRQMMQEFDGKAAAVSQVAKEPAKTTNGNGTHVGGPPRFVMPSLR